MLGFCSSVEFSSFFSFSNFNFLSLLFFSTFIPLFAFPTVLFLLQLIFNVYKYSLSLHIYSFFLFFLSFPLKIFVSFFFFHCFIPHLPPCFSFVFQFVLKLVLFLTGKYTFWFPLFAGSVYCIFVGQFSLCLWVYMYMHIFFNFNYYLPDFVSKTL